VNADFGATVKARGLVSCRPSDADMDKAASLTVSTDNGPRPRVSPASPRGILKDSGTVCRYHKIMRGLSPLQTVTNTEKRIRDR